jgi:hypothetical protein
MPAIGTAKNCPTSRFCLLTPITVSTVLIQAIRRHIENGLHWVLDVTFREDDSRVRDRTAARNLAILRKIAINLMGRDRSPRISMRARRKQAAWNDDYMLSLLDG